MKKLLFIILTLLFTNELFALGGLCHIAYSQTGMSYLYETKTCYSKLWQTSLNPNTVGCLKLRPCEAGEKDNTGAIFEYDKGLFLFDNDTGLSEIPNPDPNSNSPRCEETFIKDGQFYNCNPATNEAEFVENSEGFEEKEDGIYPKCKAGFSVHNIGRLTSSGTENQFYCLKNSNDEPSKWVGQTPLDTSNSSGSYYTPNAGKDYSWQDSQGNSYNYTPSTGVLITKDAITGSMSAHAVGSSFQPGDSFTPNGLGYAPNPDGSYGNVGTGGNNNGSGENPNPNPNPTNPDEPIDNEPASNSCNDSSLTLQEKMLCEMNAGIKKLNSESTPSNGLNQLMKDLNNKSTQLNDSLDTVKNNTNVTNQNLNNTNTKLDNLNTSTNTTNTKLDNLNTTLNKLDTTLKDIEKNTKTNGVPGEENGEDIDLDSINNKGDSISSGIDALFDIYSTFSTNIQNQFSNIKTQIQDTQNLIIEPSNIFNKTQIVSCPTSYTIDFSSFGIANKIITIDFCEYTSTLKPLIYLFVYVVLMLGLISLAIRFIGVII